MSEQRQPTVSVIIPAKNEETNIPRLLDSLARLDYDASLVQAIVVDNGSTDRTRELAAAAGAEVIHEPAGTIAHLRNVGTAAARGEVLAFLDADMEVYPGWLTAAVEQLEQPGVGAVGGMLHIPAETTWVEKTWYKHVCLRPHDGKTAWLGSGNLIMKRSVFDEIGGWNAGLETCEDLDLCDRLKRGYDLYHMVDVAAIHHGGVKTLGEMFRKELWRGKDAARRILHVWRSPRELQSFAFPLLHGLALVGLVVALALRSPAWPYFAAGALLFPALRTGLGFLSHRSLVYVPRFLVVWFVYYTARAIAPFAKKKPLQRRSAG